MLQSELTEHLQCFYLDEKVCLQMLKQKDIKLVINVQF